MKITYLKLEKYKRFPLSNLEIFEKEFTHKLTMIVGPNGAGKSSLISELTPLPASKDNFHKGGYKEIHIEHDNKQYKLVSDFREHTKFYFYCDDENLNVAGLVTMQKELVYQHFGITTIIHELLTGAENFTEMSLLGRKKLFHATTHLNIDSILSNYDKLKEELKNNEFLHKNITNQLVMEKHKLSDTNAIQTLRDKINSYRNHIDSLLMIRQEIYRFSHGKTMEESAQGLRALEDARKLTFDTNYVHLVSYSVKDIPIHLQTKQSELTVIETQLRSLYTKLEQLIQEKKTLAMTNSKNIDELQKEYDDIDRSITNRRNNIVIFKEDFDNISEVISTLQILESALPEIIETLPENADRRYSKQRYADLTEAKSAILVRLNVLLEEHSRFNAELRELENHKHLNCPNCDHTWLPKEVDSRIIELREKIGKIEKERFDLGTEVKDLQTKIDDQTTYLTQLQLLLNHYTSTKAVLFQVWDVISQRSLLHNEPAAIIQVVRRAIQECLMFQSIQDYQKRKAEILDLINRLKELTHTNQAGIDEDISSTENDIYELQSRQEDVKTAIKDIKYVSGIYSTLQKLESAIKLSTSDLHDSNLRHLSLELMREIDAELSLTKVSLLEIEKEISKQNMVESNISKLEAQLEEVGEHVKVLTILTDELSPKNGFIAKTISNFLNVIINSINSIIAGVWDYKMILKPINIEEDALNYKFKVEVEDRLVIDDINKVSGGMKEIINLAMKITLYKLLRLENYPIYLDEYGVKLDQQHRGKIADIIFKMINSNVYSQIFLITHIDMAFSYAKDTEVLEL